MSKHPIFTIICMFFIYTGIFGTAFCQDAILGVDAPADFKWKSATDTQMCYRPVSLDGKQRLLFVKVGDFFAPVPIRSTRTLKDKYPAEIDKTLTFYTRSEIDGKPYFTPVLNAKTDMLKDAVIGIFSTKDGSLNAICLDIGQNKMPVPSFNVVNMSPRTLALALDEKPFALKPFESKTKEFSKDKVKITSANLRTYALQKGQPPKQLLSKTYSLWTDKRMIVFIFDLPKPMEGDYLKDSEVPTSMLVGTTFR